ncbi:MAG: carbohydrate binding domain-containing protein [Bacteroidales bacterium]|jgi:alpha-N-arabinofuranosidase|nr:carbohydrate binding domain-containing protein [Bacteroidales bacterium]
MKQTTSLLLLLFSFLLIEAQVNVQLNVSEKKADVQPEMYGVFFEDINYGADGGLYAELIKNRSFEFEHPFVGWLPFGDVVVQDESPCFDKNPHYVRITGKGLRTGSGLQNEGFKGIGIKNGNEYRITFYARVQEGDKPKLRFEIINSSNDAIAHAELQCEGNTWKKYTTVVRANATDAHCVFRVVALRNGTLDVDHISLFPVNTWNGRDNGLRQDLMQALYDLKPGVFRFPGGCIVEGNTLDSRYQWKNSVGPVENRPLNINRWNYTFKHKFSPDYYQTYGLGFYEYFFLSEDLGAAPLPVLNCGMACQYESTELVPLGELEPYIQDALDLIEFANGDVTTKWGKLRADMGHPASFNMKFLGIGNEQWDYMYVERLAFFVKALREQHPEIVIIGSSGPAPDGDKFDYLWPEMSKLGLDLVDEHYYRSPEWFLANAGRYDSYDRKGPKVFAGEFAAHPDNKANNFEGALSEAAFMTGLERNADVVLMATYAPLFAHVDGWQWRPDMIWFDNLNCVKTPNYYVQQMYASNPGTHTIAIEGDSLDLKGEKGIYASAVVDQEKSEIIVKIVNVNTHKMDFNLSLNGLKRKQILADKANVSVLQTYNMNSQNTLDNPLNIVPQNEQWEVKDATIKHSLEGCAFYVLKVKMN